METKKAAIYARVSSDKQDTDLSISAQIRAMKEYAAKNGYEVAREFVDEAESGRSADRPAFKEMVAISRRSSKPFEVVLVWKYSRFARSREDSIVYKTMLRKHGVRVISITEPFDDTPTGRLLEAMIESLDEFYSANLGEEIMRGLKESVMRGFFVNSYAPYGYRKVKVKDGNKDRVKLEPDGHKAEIVGQIFADFLKGKGLKEIGKELNTKGIASPTNTGWGKTSLYHILTNEIYTGTSVWGRSSNNPKVKVVRCENAWPELVSRADYERIQKLLKERAPDKQHPRRTTSKYLLSGISHCGICGKALVGQDAKSGRFSYYVCGTLLKKGAGACDAKYLNAQKFEEAVIKEIRSKILTRDNLRALAEMVSEEMDACAADYKKQLESVDIEMHDVSRRLGKLYDALETGVIDLQELAPRIKELRDRQESLTLTKMELEDQFADRKVKLSDFKFIEECADDLSALLSSNGSLAERRSFIRSFVKDVRVKEETVEITYTIPMPPSDIAHGETAVLSLVQHGSAYGIRTRGLRLERAVS